VCEAKKGAGFYRARQARQTPFYQLVERFYPEFKAVYEERYQQRYGFWRPAIDTAVEKVLECGDLQHGFARVRCPDCAHEFFVAYSCRGRCLCPSCHQKRALQTALWVSQEVCAPVPHRQFVFTIPKRLRIYFRFERRLLGELCRAAWRVVRSVFQSVSGHPDAVPGMIGAIQTCLRRGFGRQAFGDLIHAHPHIHALVSEGVFLPDLSACGHAQAGGTYVPLPKLATEPFLKLWEQAVFDLLLAESKITEEIVMNIRGWQHSGFSVDQSVRLEAGDTEGIQRLIEYFLPCPFSQARMIEVTGQGKVIYKTGDNRLGRFPEAASEDLLAGPKRNFQIFEPLDFLAEVTQHIPDPGDLVRYYGFYSNKSRGLRTKGQARAAPATAQNSASAPSAKQARKRWAALIKQVYEIDPLSCPNCGGRMKIISFIERDQSEVIEKILRHRGLWEEAPARDPPPVPEPVMG
jgi:hypothetical protein